MCVVHAGTPHTCACGCTDDVLGKLARMCKSDLSSSVRQGGLVSRTAAVQEWFAGAFVCTTVWVGSGVLFEVLGDVCVCTDCVVGPVCFSLTLCDITVWLGPCAGGVAWLAVGQACYRTRPVGEEIYFILTQICATLHAENRDTFVTLPFNSVHAAHMCVLACAACVCCMIQWPATNRA